MQLVINIDDKTALALAQLVKRFGFRDARRNAVNDDEAYIMMDAINAIQNELAEHGIAPR